MIKLKISTLFSMLATLSFIFVACGEDEPNFDVNQCTTPTTVESDGIILDFQGITARQPSNVSMIFRAQEGLAADTVPITDLQGDIHFSIFENGQAISPFESDFAIVPKTDIFVNKTLLILDLSGSVLANSLDDLKDAAEAFILSVMPGSASDNYGEVEMQIMWFDGQTNLQGLVQFTPDREQLLSGIQSITPNISNDNSTNLNGAVINGISLLRNDLNQQSNIIKAGSVVIFTDGSDTAGRRTQADAVEAVNIAQQEGITINTIGLGGSIDENALASFGVSGFFFANDVNELVPRFEETAAIIRAEVNSTYVFQYCSPKRAGSHEITMQVDYNGKSGSITSCFLAEGFQGGCSIN